MDYFEYLRAIRASKLSTKARIVALIIASYNPSRPTNKQIAEGTGLCERTVRNAKAELVAAGYLWQDRTWNAANHYTPMAIDATPQATHAVGEARDYHLNTNINTKINTNLNTKEIQREDDDSNESSLVNSLKEIKPEGIVTLDTNDEWFSGRTLNEAAASPRPNRWDDLKKLGDELWG